MEYFVARALYDLLKRYASLDCENVKTIFGQRLIEDENLIDHESDVMSFLIEMIENNDQKQEEDKSNETNSKIITKIITLKFVFNLEEKQEEFGSASIYSKNMFKIAMRLEKVFKTIKDEVLALLFNNLGKESFYDSCKYDFIAAMIRFENTAKNYGYEKYYGNKLFLKNLGIEVPHGKGKITYSDGFIYEGNFEKGERHGYGTLTFPDGSWYKGDFENGRKYGQGEFKSVENRSFYKGAFEKGKKNGKRRRARH